MLHTGWKLVTNFGSSGKIINTGEWGWGQGCLPSWEGDGGSGFEGWFEWLFSLFQDFYKSLSPHHPQWCGVDTLCCPERSLLSLTHTHPNLRFFIITSRKIPSIFLHVWFLLPWPFPAQFPSVLINVVSLPIPSSRWFTFTICPACHTGLITHISIHFLVFTQCGGHSRKACFRHICTIDIHTSRVGVLAPVHLPGCSAYIFSNTHQCRFVGSLLHSHLEFHFSSLIHKQKSILSQHISRK